MPRRTIYYVFLVTLLWGALAEKEEKIRDTFQSNMTRNDFSNLLKSLIKLNEQRVSVLQKLYRLEDYGVLSEVLRTRDTQPRNGNQNNMVLVVLSKNLSVPTRRDMGHMQNVDSVPSLDTLINKIQTPELSFKSSPPQVPVFGNMEVKVVDTAKSFNKSENIVKTPEVRARAYPQQQYVLKQDGVRYNPLKKDNFEVVSEGNMHPKAPRKKNRFKIDDGRHFTTTASKERAEEDNRNLGPPKLMEVEVIDTKHHKIIQEKFGENHNSNYPTLSSLTDSENKNYHKIVKGRYEIVSDGRNKQRNANQKSLKSYNNKNYPLIPRDINQDNLYSKTDLSIENDRINKYLKKQKHAVSNENNESHKYSKADSIVFHINDHSKYPPPTTNNHGGKYPQIARDKSDENYRGNKYPKITSDVSTENDHSHKGHREIIHESAYDNKYPKIATDNSNEQNHGNKYSKVDREITDYNEHRPSNIDRSSENTYGNKYPSLISDNYSNENNHGNKYPTIIRDDSNENNHGNKYPKVSRDNSNENYHGIKYTKITRDNPDENDHVNKYPMVNKDSYNENDHEETLAARVSIEKGHNDNDPKRGKNMSYEDDLGSKNTIIAKDTSDGDDYDSYDKMSIETYGGTKTNTNPAKDKSQENVQQYPKSNPTGFGQTDGEPESRKTFQKCISKKFLKMCTKSCVGAYINVCRRLKCTSRSKKALKKECKRSCKKSFSSSKYSNEDRS